MNHDLAPAVESLLRDAREGGQGAVALLRDAGCRPTPQRLLVLQSLGAGGHLTADDALAHVKERYPAVNASTVYRTLEALTDAGLVHRTDLGGSRSHYELTRQHRHHHAVCERCGGIAHIHDEDLAPVVAALAASTGFRFTQRSEIALPGVCPACQAIERGDGPPSAAQVPDGPHEHPSPKAGEV